MRNKDDQWIRIALEKGDMIVLPEGIYHRFTLDDTNYVKVQHKLMKHQQPNGCPLTSQLKLSKVIVIWLVALSCDC